MIGWLVLFVVHSTLWCVLAWGWTRIRPQSHARIRETIWYSALVASFVTPTTQALASSEMAFWHLPVGLPEIGAGDEHTGLRTERHREHSPSGAPSNSSRLPRPKAEEHHRGSSRSLISGRHGLRFESEVFDRLGWVWLGTVGTLLCVYGGRFYGLKRRLRTRENVTDPNVRRLLKQIRRRAGQPKAPRLSACECLGSPIAFGLGQRAEICIPTRAMYELDQEELGALLGHEVAHLIRRDILSLYGLKILQTVFFFQPFFRFAVHGIQSAAEEQCDDWAAQHSGDRFAMASCLAEVAGWIVHRQEEQLPVVCMARKQSPLGARIARLLNDSSTAEAPPTKRWNVVAFLGLLTLALLLAPFVGFVSGEVHGEHDGRNIEEGHQRKHHSGEHLEYR